MSEIDNLLDATLDDLEDLPTFEPFPAGVHRALVSMNEKEVNGHQSIEVSCKMVETIELAEPTKAEAPKAGSEASVLCMLDNEFGRGNFKALAKPLGAAFGTISNREIVEQTKDIECLIVTSLKQDKNDKTVFRMNIKELEVV